tara:strand:- start:8879 stop:10192 length:1314 start_codon:yes stop_codon:yes gene_type:complete
MKVLISGAGIAGLALARLLQDEPNIEITLVEKRKQPSIKSAGIALPANAVTALRTLGLGSQIDSIAHQVNQIRYTDANEKVIAQASLLETPLNLDKFVALDRQALRNILVEGMNIPIQYGTSITHIENTDNGANVVFNQDNSTQQNFDLVIAADGINSELRTKEAQHNGPLKDLGVLNWRFILDTPTKHIQPTYQFGDTQGKLLMTYPISDNQVYIYAHLKAPTIIPKNAKSDLIDFIQQSFSEFGGLGNEMLNKLDNQTHIVSGRLKSVPGANFYAKRVVFVGDASNACSPMLQQGAAAAFEDVLTLAKMLKCYSIPRALQEYQQFRQPRVEWLIKSSDGPFALMAKLNRWLGSWWGAAVRNMLFRIKGPLNVAGWRTLLASNPLTLLNSITPKEIPPSYFESKNSTVPTISLEKDVLEQNEALHHKQAPKRQARM